jgi:hypothetical protein
MHDPNPPLVEVEVAELVLEDEMYKDELNGDDGTPVDSDDEYENDTATTVIHNPNISQDNQSYSDSNLSQKSSSSCVFALEPHPDLDESINYDPSINDGAEIENFRRTILYPLIFLQIFIIISFIIIAHRDYIRPF